MSWLIKNLKSNYPAIILIAGILVIGVLLLFNNNYDKTCIKTEGFNKCQIRAELADTETERSRGLGGRGFLPEKGGMLFVFDSKDKHCFWMKDMKFPIDIIWLDDVKKVVNIESNVKPDTYPTGYCPESLARYVIEVNAGMAAELNWDAGDLLNF